VIRRLMDRNLPDEVRIVDFGIRGLDLAYALQDGYETTILVDAYPHGQTPGTVSLVEPDLKNLTNSDEDFLQPHAMHPINVLRMANAMSGALKRVLVVGCEPADLGGDEGRIGLSKEVEAAIDGAVNSIESVVKRILDGTGI
jgi:hydrogenase maturation protease